MGHQGGPSCLDVSKCDFSVQEGQEGGSVTLTLVLGKVIKQTTLNVIMCNQCSFMKGRFLPD